MKKLPLMFGMLFLLTPLPAWCGDAATLIFKSGQVVYVDDGFREIVAQMKELNSKSQEHRIVELNIGGGSFILNAAEVVIVCRDKCQSLKVIDQRDPARRQS